MSTALVAAKPITLNSITITPAIRKIGIVGAGDVTRKKIWPAVQALSVPLDAIAVCSLESRSPLNGPEHLYVSVGPDSLLPFDDLDAHGFLSRDTLWLIATSSIRHTHYVALLVPFCPVAPEKPIAGNGRQARALLPLLRRYPRIYPIDHKLFNAAPLSLLAECRANPSLLRAVRRIEGTFFEAAGVTRGRQVDDCIADLQWHLLVIIVALFKTLDARLEIALERVSVATHATDPAGGFEAPGVWTASRLAGRLSWDGHQVTIDLRQAKGAPRDQKALRLLDQDGALIREISLKESGWQAHARLLTELCKPVPDMRHSLEDAIAIMELVDAARAMASEDKTYAFGSLPAFLEAVPAREEVKVP
jgi:predicted dehydrogenase